MTVSEPPQDRIPTRDFFDGTPWIRITPTRFGYRLTGGPYPGIEWLGYWWRFTKRGAYRLAERLIAKTNADAARHSRAWTVTGDTQ